MSPQAPSRGHDPLTHSSGPLPARRSVAVALVILISLTVCSICHAEVLTGSGCSVSNTGYLVDLAKEYERRTGVKVYVRGGGSVVGIEDLRSGKVDFAASCRNREQGDPADVTFIQVAWDALVFIVHPSNPVANISVAQVRGLYEGRITSWKQLGGRDVPVRLFLSRPRRGLSGVESSTRTMILKGEEPVGEAQTMTLASTGLVEQMVEDTPEGFATTGYTSARKRSVKLLRVDGITPSAKTITSGAYRMKRPLYLLVPQRAKPAVTRFVEFVLSREGQDYLRTLGVVALGDPR